MLSSVYLQNFRSYKKASFDFSPLTTVIIGQNTAGKTNLIESIFMLSCGRSFRGRDLDVISFSSSVSRVKASFKDSDIENLEIAIALQEESIRRKFLVNGVSKRRGDFVGHMPAVLFTPLDLEIISDGPGVRRVYLDTILEQTDIDYRHALSSYEQALRSRNRLLEDAKKARHKKQSLFDYWDMFLIANGEIITSRRAAYIDYLNKTDKEIFPFKAEYDKSIISSERLLQYERQEIDAGITLVGPQRDDIKFYFETQKREIKVFGSRGQQRLAVLQLKAIELLYIQERLGQKPLFILDDIFSELDQKHIDLVLSMTKNYQTIMTTTHKEFVEKKAVSATMIELGK